MKKNMPKLERFLAVVLVLSMILSFVPSGALARESAQNDVTALSAKLVREKVEERAEPEEPETPTEGPSEPTDGPTEPTDGPTDPTDGPADPTEEPVAPMAETSPAEPEPVYVYNYTLTVLVDDEEQEITGENVAWFHEDGEPVEETSEKAGVLEKMQQDSIYAVVTYDGISFTVKLTDGDTRTVQVAAAQQPWSEQVAVGGLFTLGYGLSDETVRGLIHEREISENLTAAEQENTYYTTEACEFTITDTWTSGSGVVYARQTYTAQSVKKIPSAVFSINGAAVQEWYDKPQSVKVTVNNSELNLHSPAYLPAVTVGEESFSNWTRENNTFALNVDVNESATVYYAKGTEAEASMELKIDTVKPVAQIQFQMPGFTGIWGSYRVITGPSGLATLNINGVEIDISDARITEQEDGTIEYAGSFRGVPSKDTTEIVAVNGAGVSSNAFNDEMLEVTFQDVPDSALIDAEHLADGNQRLLFQITNADESLTIEAQAKDQDGNQITDLILTTEDAGKTYNGSVSLANGLSELIVTVTNPDAPEDERSMEYSYDGRYVFDQTPPVVSVSRDKAPSNAEGGVEFFAEAVTYRFTIEDELLSYEDFRVEYMIEGFEEPKTAKYNKVEGCISVKVENKQTLRSMTVIGQDKTGNPVEEVLVVGENTFTWGEGTTYNCNVIVDSDPPEITAVISDNVKLFYTKDGKSFAVLDQEKNCDTVTLTVTVKDANLDTESLTAAGWKPEGSNSYTITFTAEVPEHGTGELKYSFRVKDKAGLMGTGLVDDKVIVQVADDNQDGYSNAINLAKASDTYAGSILIDRRPPSSVDDGAPRVNLELNQEAKPGQTADGLDLFNKAFSYKMAISDKSVNGFDSGLKSVDWKLDYTLWGEYDEEIENAVTCNENQNGLSGEYTIGIQPKDGIEATAMLTITVEDMVGNNYAYVKNFVVDTRAPRVVTSYVHVHKEECDKEECPGEECFVVNDKEYYGATRNLTVSVIDMNPNVAADQILVDGQKVGERKEDGSYEVAFGEGGEYTVQIDAADAMGNAAAVWTDAFTIDKTPPVIAIQVGYADSVTIGELKNSVGDADYFDAPILLRVMITDDNLVYDENSAISVATVTYTTEAEGEQKQDLSDWRRLTTTSGKTCYIKDIKLTDGDVLTGISVSARDNANNPAKSVTLPEELNKQEMQFEAVSSENGPAVFSSSRKLVVDATQPKVTVTKTAEEDSYVQTFEGHAYYNAPVTYSFVIEDQFLDLVEDAGVIEVKAIFNDGTEVLEQLTPEEETPAEETPEEPVLLSDVDSYSYKFTVEDGRALERIEILARDNTGWNVEKPVVVITGLEGVEESSAVMKTVVDEQGNEQQEPATRLTTDFVADEEQKVWSYSGEPIIVDTAKPELSLEFSDNVSSFYTNGSTIYVILDNPVKAGGNNAAEQHVTVTFEAKDKNLTLKDNVYAVRSGDQTPDWVGTTQVNADSTLTLTATSANIPVNEVGGFVIDANVIDLAGNPAAEYTFVIGNNTSTIKPDADGHFNRTISLDRRTPSTANDNQAPVIKITPSITPVKTADGKDLFNGSFTYSLNVTDGTNSDLNAGLKSVKWTVKDRNGVVAESNVTKGFDTRELSWSANIPVTINGNGESNEVEIYIEAVDNVDNTITYTDTIGADNLAPRVTIDQSNHSVKNDFYFNANQDITVTIEDLNFDASRSTVDTQVGVPAWTSLGDNKYRVTLAYHSDGDYTFAMASTDLAGNAATIDIPVVLQKFTIDKTAPVINVTFDPSVPVDTDGAGVQYFDKNRTVTVSITEHNFRASDVRADLGSANALGGWSSRNDTHTAAETFTEGNNYRVTVNYEDLAGNPAQTYTSPAFSVDLNAPTISMTSGNLNMGQLNIVPDDLVLGFTIEDGESNLKDFYAEVVFLDRHYREHKVEGAEFYTVTNRGSRTVGYVNFANIAQTKENDGIYTIRLYAVDYAGHVVDLSPALTVSLNRFGSSFQVDDPYTKEFLTPDETGVVYRDNVTDALIIKEINPTQVWQDTEHTAKGSVITIAVNGKSITLEEGVHYDLAVAQRGDSNSRWYEYTYSIYPDVFLKDGELVDGNYAIFFYSEDEAGNQNSNETNADALLQMDANGTYSGKISFVLDHQPPVVTILGVESGEASFDTNRQVEINISDNTPAAIEIYINGELVERIELGQDRDISSDWFYYDEASGSYYLNIAGKKVPQDLKVVVTDAAGNQIEHEVNRLMLTDDLVAQYLNSVPAIMISIVLLIVLVILIIVLAKKRKKDSEKTPVKA